MAGSRRRDLSEEESALWAKVVDGVTPLRRPRRCSAPHAPASGEALPAASPETPAPEAPPQAPFADESGDGRQRRPSRAPGTTPLAPLERRLVQRVVRGVVPVDARLDLHGLHQAEAEARLVHFLLRAQERGARLVLVITGKGGPPGRPGDLPERGVLRRVVPHWLARPDLRRTVLGFEEAHIAHGGAGALYVRLRRKKRGSKE